MSDRPNFIANWQPDWQLISFINGLGSLGMWVLWVDALSQAPGVTRMIALAILPIWALGLAALAHAAIMMPALKQLYREDVPSVVATPLDPPVGAEKSA